MNTNKEKKRLFDEFPPIEKSKWEETIIADLKGGDYEKKLVWLTEDGLKVQPYYCAEDIESLSSKEVLPSKYPFVRGTKADNNWEIRQKIVVNNPIDANKEALEVLQKGADAVSFVVDNLNELKDLANLLRGIDLETNAIHFISAPSNLHLLELFLAILEQFKVDKTKVNGSFNFDSFSYYLLHGNYWISNESNMEEVSELISKVRREIPGFKVLNIGGQHLHNAGATTVQELAFTLASGADYLVHLSKYNLSIMEILKSMQFTYSIGSSYFMEIAKFRAARMLWAKIAQQFEPGCEGCTKIYIHAVTSQYNKTLYDPYVNMLRTTTEAMSAAMASVDAMTILPFDTAYSHGNAFSKRIARNQQVILKEEAHLGKIVDPGAGSYYIEKLTNILAEEAWKLFLKVEEMGGFVKAMESGFIAAEIKKSADSKTKNIASRKTNILGTNQFPNLGDAMLSKIEKTVKEDKVMKRHRGSEIFETLRLQTEKFVEGGNKKPVVFLFTFGNLAMRKARASFSTNFYACAGFDIIDNNGFATAQEGLTASAKAKADIIVLCSADEEYLNMAKEIMEIVKVQNIQTKVVVAGYPTEQIEDLKALGISDFIHLKTNVIDNLTSLQKELGI